MDPQIIFQGIECPNLRLQAKSLLEDIVQLCPSDSAVQATFRHLQDSFLAEINVESESVRMHATDRAAILNECLDHIRSKMLGQIIDWRAHRFAS